MQQIPAQNIAALGQNVRWSIELARDMTHEFASTLPVTLPDPVGLDDQISLALDSFYGDRIEAVITAGHRMGELDIPEAYNDNSCDVPGYRVTPHIQINVDYLNHNMLRYQFRFCLYPNSETLAQLMTNIGLPTWVLYVLPYSCRTIYGRPSWIKEPWLNTTRHADKAWQHQQVLSPELQNWLDVVVERAETWLNADIALNTAAENKGLFRRYDAVKKKEIEQKLEQKLNSDLFNYRRATLQRAITRMPIKHSDYYFLVPSIDRVIGAGRQKILCEMMDRMKSVNQLKYDALHAAPVSISGWRRYEGVVQGNAS